MNIMPTLLVHRKRSKEMQIVQWKIYIAFIVRGCLPFTRCQRFGLFVSYENIRRNRNWIQSRTYFMKTVRIEIWNLTTIALIYWRKWHFFGICYRNTHSLAINWNVFFSAQMEERREMQVGGLWNLVFVTKKNSELVFVQFRGLFFFERQERNNIFLIFGSSDFQKVLCS